MTTKALLLASAIMISGTALASGTEGAWLADFRRADLNDSGGLSALELDKAQLVIEVQKKLASLLGLLAADDKRGNT